MSIGQWNIEAARAQRRSIIGAALAVLVTLGLLILAAPAAHAAIIGTYVDAEALYGLDNTTPTSAFYSPGYSGSTSDNLWDDRPSLGLNSSGVLASVQNVIEAGAPGVGGDNVSPITTTVSGLLPYGVYDVYVLYWTNDGAEWSVRANLSAPSDAYTEFDTHGTVGRTEGTSTGITDGYGPSTTLFEALVGTSHGSTIQLNILNTTTSIYSRTVYDGLAYDLVSTPEPASLGLLLIGAPLLARRRRR